MMDRDAHMRRSARRTFVYGMASCVILCMIIAGSLELWARVIESRNISYGTVGWSDHGTLGWISTPGSGTALTAEYEAHYDVNNYGMGDGPIEETAGVSKIKIMALGDSHTFAVGVSSSDAWPNVLERTLFAGDPMKGSVYNCAVAGYNLGQYLLQMRRLAPIIKPNIVLIGFTIASDLYDLIPPRKGGFVFGSDRGRVYFDLDDKGNLIEIRDLAGKALATSPKVSLAGIFRNALNRSVFLKRFKRSKLAMWMMMNVRPHGKTLWASPDTAFAIRLDSEYEYRWLLARKLIEQISSEARAGGAKVVLVNIPYIPQVYDDVWAASYGRFPKDYDRFIAGDRLKQICKETGVYYVDVTVPMCNAVKKTNKWLHYHVDGHPNREGHKIIAECVRKFLEDENLVAL